MKHRIWALIILFIGILIAYFIYASEPKIYGKLSGDRTPYGSEKLVKFPFKLGLDLSGGSHLVYKADLSNVASADQSDSLDSLRDVIERRVNLFGVSEPIVQIEEGSAVGGTGGEKRLVVELPGITNVEQAIKTIGETPSLIFKTERPDGPEKDRIVKAHTDYQKAVSLSTPVNERPFSPLLLQDPYYVDTELTGRFLDKALVDFDQTTRAPKVVLQFNSEGDKLFAQITKANVDKTVAIYLDGSPISTPVVREEIKGGRAEITGNFTPQEVKTLVGRLNSGALPVPISLISTQVIGAPLGEKALRDGVYAGIIGLLAVAIFLIVWYRLPGVIAVLALAIYVAIMLLIFKLIPITLTAAGIAGFILSVGMAVDANILIAERTKEEIRRGKPKEAALELGFSRAWTSIRDSNVSSIITSLVLIQYGTGIVRGFAVTLLIGVLVSMFSAIVVTRTFLRMMYR